MTKQRPGAIQVKSFGDHHVITQPNPLRKVLLRVPESDLTIPWGAEKALAGLSGELKLDTIGDRPLWRRAPGVSRPSTASAKKAFRALAAIKAAPRSASSQVRRRACAAS
jgi:hypothetical protein